MGAVWAGAAALLLVARVAAQGDEIRPNCTDGSGPGGNGVECMVTVPPQEQMDYALPKVPASGEEPWEVMVDMAYDQQELDGALKNAVLAVEERNRTQQAGQIACPKPETGNNFVKFLESRNFTTLSAADRTHPKRVTDRLSSTDQRDSAFVRLNVTSSDVIVRLRNCNQKTPLSMRFVVRTTRLEETTDESNNDTNCPLGPELNQTKICSSNGQCAKGGCTCEEEYLGSACEIKVHTMRDPATLKNETLGPGDWRFYQLPLLEQTCVRVTLNTTAESQRGSFPFLVTILQDVVPLKAEPVPGVCSTDEPDARCTELRPVLDLDSYATDFSLAAADPNEVNASEQSSQGGFKIFATYAVYNWQPNPERENLPEAKFEFGASGCGTSLFKIIVPMMVSLACFFFLTALAITCARVGFAVRHRRHHRVRPLSKAQLDAQLPPFSYAPPEKDCDISESGDPKCSICLCDVGEGERLRRLPCQHTYHQECVDPWISRHLTCPDCRTPFEMKGERKSIWSRRGRRRGSSPTSVSETPVSSSVGEQPPGDARV